MKQAVTGVDTIYAVSSGQPPAAIAVLRISGPRAMDASRALAGTLPAPRRAALRRLSDPGTGGTLDHALVLVFPGPHSATGEDLVELHVHGGRAVVAAVMAALSCQAGLRAAEAGEFTRRALTNGRLDLTEAEGLGDLLLAETEAQRRAALTTSEGGVRRQVELWTTELLSLSARIEAAIDYSDEEEVSRDDLSEVQRPIVSLAAAVSAALSRPPVERLRDGIRVVLAGPPNAGKSSLLNALIDRDVAIVSSIPGTTRDRIEASVVRAGLAWILTDTAGLRDAEDAIEHEGILRADQAMREADVVVWLGDELPPVEALWVYPRCDAPDRSEAPDGPQLSVSARTGQGLSELWALLAVRAQSLLPRSDHVAYNERQRGLLYQVRASLSAGAAANDILIVAEELRSARLALDRVTGRGDIEGVLDALFGRFCIGK